MGGLKDELVKRGIVADSRARQVAHEEKARKAKLGPAGVSDEQQRRHEQRQEREQTRRAADRCRDHERQQNEHQREARRALTQLLRDHAVTQGIRGPRRFYFVTRQRTIPFVEVSEDASKRLETGALAICELPDAPEQQFVIVPADVAARVRQTAPEFVLFHNQRP